MGVDCVFYVKKFKSDEEAITIIDQLRHNASKCPVSSGQIYEKTNGGFELNWPYGLTIGKTSDPDGNHWVGITTCLRLHNAMLLQHQLMEWINQSCHLEGDNRCYVGGDSGQASHLALRRYTDLQLIDAE
jgi:hypothetical protein